MLKSRIKQAAFLNVTEIVDASKKCFSPSLELFQSAQVG